jgi:uncharacterized membrane protein
MADPQAELQELSQAVRDLLRRVYRLEVALGIEQPQPSQAPPSAAAVPQAVPTATVPTDTRPVAPPTPFRRPARAVQGDLESRIGSHWLNRIGIAAVLIGVSYFLKYAFENNWIGPAGRITVGLIAGIAVVVWSEWFRSRGYRIFSYSLKAVGIGVLYLSLWAAFQVYSLIPGGVAFFAMLMVTSATAVLALTQDAEILAAFAMAGGFVTPALLSTGVNRELQLFTYVAVLDLAMLGLLLFRAWRRLLLLSFFGTLALYLGWYVSFYTRSQLRITLAFATLFFAMFAVVPLVARSRNQDFLSTHIPLVLTFLNAGVYFLEGYAMLQDVSNAAVAWFAIVLAAVYLLLSRQVRQGITDAASVTRLRYLHVALAVGFITVAIPIRLEAHWITIGWFVEAAVLLWVAGLVESTFLSLLSVSALGLGVVRLLFFDNFHPAHLILNARMATYAVAIGVLAGVAWFGSKRENVTWRSGAAVAVIALNLLALIAFSREISDYYSRQMVALSHTQTFMPFTISPQWRNLTLARDFSYSALWMGYGAALMAIGFSHRSAFVRWQALVLIAVTTVKVFVYDVSQLDRGYRIVSFIVLGILLLGISFAYQRDWLKLAGRAANSSRPGESVIP